MHKAIFIYSLFAFGYFGFSTIPIREVSAAETIALTSGNNQSTTRGGTYSNGVTFTATDGGTAVNNETVTFTSKETYYTNAKISTTGATGTFSTPPLTATTNSSGQVTIHIKINASSFYDTTGVTAGINVTDLSNRSVVSVTGTITDVLYFSDGTSTTRSVVTGTAANTNIGAAVSATHWANADALTTNDVTLEYSFGGGTDDALFNIGSTTGQLTAKAASTLSAVNSYSVKVKVEEKGGGTTARSSDTIDVTINVTNVNQSPPPQDQPSNSPGNTQSPVETEPATEQTPPKRKIIYECPVGWTRGSVFGNTKKALIYELKVNVDRTNRISIYELASLAIYVYPDENLETLDGWTLKVGTLYNQFGKEFKLTAENSVIDEHGFAHIKNPEEIPIPMGTLGYIGQSLPSFDYRLYDAQGVRVDFGISCYKAGGLTWRLWNTKDPRLLRVLPLGTSEEALSVQMQNLDWNTPFFRSEWTAAVMPDLPAAPFAPSKPKVNVVGTWADLKKQ